jgi:hypothetical protein
MIDTILVCVTSATAVFIVGFELGMLASRRSGAARERARILNHGWHFQAQRDKFSPSLTDFLRAVENGEHLK